MRSVSILLLVLAAFAVVSVQAQAPIPYRVDGYQVAGPVDAPIVVDLFVDLLCPDCAAAWPNMKSVIDYYGNKISVLLHTFPLPYHYLGFPVAQAMHVVVRNGASPRAFADFIFANQGSYWNDALANATLTQVTAQLSSVVVANGFSSAAQFAAGMANPTINMETRVSWKYACSRGVLGTPTYLVNGVQVQADPDWGLAQWRQMLDPLLQPQVSNAQCQRLASRSSPMFVDSAMDCPPTAPPCEYLPGKVQCCRAGEMCIPNVGCRC